MLKHMKKDNSLGMVGPVTNATGNESKINIDYKDMPQMRKFAWDYTQKHLNEEYRDIRMLAMFCVMFPREIYEKVGKLDENFGVGMFEDDDYSMSIKNLGYNLTVVEDSYVHHYGSESFKKINDEKRLKMFNDNRKYYEEK